MKYKKMNNFDLLRAINFSYGKVLDEWKEAGIIPEKEAMLEVASPFSVPFILENYTLTEEDLDVLKFSVLQNNSNNQAIIEVIEKKIEELMDNNQSFSFGEAKSLTVSEIIKKLDGKDGKPVDYHKNYDWTTIDDIFTQNSSFFESRNKHKEAFVVAVLNSVDFNKLTVRKPVFDSIANFVYSAALGSSSFNDVVSNFGFSRKILNSFSDKDSIFAHSIEHKMPLDVITSKAEATNFVEVLYKYQRDVFLLTTHQKEIPLEILEEKQKDPEYFQRYMDNRLKLQENFKRDQEVFGPNGTFIFELSHNVHKKMNTFLTNSEISKITDNNFLPGIPYDEIENHIAKIQDKVTRSIAHRLEKWNQKTLFNSHSLLDLTMFIPAGGEDKVLSNEFIEGLHKKFSTFLDKDNQEYFNRDILRKATEVNHERVVEIISFLGKDERNAPFLNRGLISNALIELEFLQKTKKYFKTVEEFEDRLTEIFIDLKSTLKVDLLSKTHLRESTTISAEAISRIILNIGGEDVDETKVKENIAAKVMKSGGNIETALCLGFILAAQNVFEFVSKEENALVGTGFYVAPGIGIDKKATPNVFTDGEIDISNKEALDFKMQSKSFRERLLSSGVKVQAKTLVSLISNTNDYLLYEEETKGLTDDIDDFIDRYLKRFPEVMDKTFIESQVLDKRVYPKVYSLFMDKLTLDKAFEDYKVGKKETLGAYVESLKIHSRGDNEINTPIKELHTFFERSINELSTKDLRAYVLSSPKVLFHHKTLLDLGYNKEDLVQLIANPDNFVPLDWKSLDEGNKKYLCERYMQHNVQDHFCKNLLICFEKEDAKIICDAFKKYAPSMLLIENFTPLLNREATIELEDIVNGAKEIAKYRMTYLKPITIGEAGCIISKDSNFEESVKNLSPEEKIVLVKYGSAFQPILSILNKEAHNKLFKPEDFDTPVTKGYASPLHLALNDVFSNEFIKENKECIAKVYNLEGFLNDTMPGNLYYNLGSSDSYFAKADKRSEFTFKGVDAWSDLIVEKSGELQDMNKIVFILRKNWGIKEIIKPKLLKDFDLTQSKNLDNFVMLLRNNCSVVGLPPDRKSINAINYKNQKEIIETISMTVLDATEETQRKFVKIYDVLNLSDSTKDKSLNHLEKIFLFSPEIESRVRALKTYLKIDSVIKSVVSEDDFNSSDDFKL